MIIEYILTDDCNLHCVHCIRGKNLKRNMNFYDAINSLKEITSYFNDPHIVLSGGEPTVYKEFGKILKYILKETELTIGICSNGTTEFFEKDICYLENYKDRLIFQISIDGDELHNDAIRGRGTFKKAIKTIEKLASLDFKVTVSTTVSSSNIKSIDNLLKDLEKIKIINWKLSPILPYGRAKTLNEEISSTAWNKFTKEIINKAKLKLNIHTLYDFEYINSFSNEKIKEIENIVKNKKTCNCGSGNNRIYIYPNMQIYGCCCLTEYSFGNIKTQSLDEILSSKNAKLIRDYKLLKDSPCQKCKYVKICNGGCKGMSLHKFGKLGFGDFRCPEFNKLLDQK